MKDKIVLILRDKPGSTADNGVWLATTEEHHESLRREFPNMRSIQVLGKPVTGWQVLPADVPDFEEAALRACELVLAGDPRIGKVPGSRRPAKKMANSSGPKARSVARVPDQELRSWQFTSTVMSMAAFLRGLRGFAKVSTTARVIFEKDTSGSRQLDAHDENETR